jgi:cytochrome c
MGSDRALKCATVEREINMEKLGKIFVALGVFLFVFGVCNIAIGQDKATPQEIVAKVQEAANTLAKAAAAKSGEASLKQFSQKDSPWVWKDSYTFVLDCASNTMAAHPIKPELVGKDITSMKDTKGNSFFGQLCEATKRPPGVWVEYWWPKPGEKEGSRKVSYAMNARGTPYVVGAGIYDDKITIAELEKLTSSTK